MYFLFETEETYLEQNLKQHLSMSAQMKQKLSAVFTRDFAVMSQLLVDAFRETLHLRHKQVIREAAMVPSVHQVSGFPLSINYNNFSNEMLPHLWSQGTSGESTIAGV